MRKEKKDVNVATLPSDFLVTVSWVNKVYERVDNSFAQTEPKAHGGLI